MTLKSIKNRRTIRRFTDEKVNRDEIRSLLLAAMYAPSAWGKRSWEFIVVEDDATRQELGNLTPYSSHLATAPVAIVVMSDMESSNSWIEDSSIAAEHINLEAARLNLGSSWVQVRGMKHDAVDAEEHLRTLLSIPGNYGICCVMAIGRPDEQKSSHREAEYESDKVHFDRFGNREMAA